MGGVDKQKPDRRRPPAETNGGSGTDPPSIPRSTLCEAFKPRNLLKHTCPTTPPPRSLSFSGQPSVHAATDHGPSKLCFFVVPLLSQPGQNDAGPNEGRKAARAATNTTTGHKKNEKTSKKERETRKQQQQNKNLLRSTRPFFRLPTAVPPTGDPPPTASCF